MLYDRAYDENKMRIVPLRRKEHVGAILRELERNIGLPVCRHFGLKYSLLGEHHPNACKAGLTIRERVPPQRLARIEEGYDHIIRVRIRSRVRPDRDMLSHGTLVAILLHELAHLKHMHHGKDFALFERDIYRFARKSLGVFDPVDLINELPSPWEWERMIWATCGEIGDEELVALHESWLSRSVYYICNLRLSVFFEGYGVL